MNPEKEQILKKIDSLIFNCEASLEKRKIIDPQLVDAKGAIRGTQMILRELRTFVMRLKS